MSSDKPVIEFQEKAHPDGRLEVRWEASTPRQWNRVLTLLKNTVPHNARKFEKSTKSWFIAPDYAHLYESIKQAVLAEDNEQIQSIDEQLDEEVIARLLNHEVSTLPPSMRRRAMFAIKAALGLIDAPVEICVSEGIFGAWNEEEGVWCYENGRYSGSSPSERDTKVINRAFKRVQAAIERMPEALADLDANVEIYWKVKLRSQMLEKYDYRCHVCNQRPETLSKLHMHRVLPGHAGGMYVESNIVILCARCHRYYEGASWDEINEAHEHTLRAS